MPVQGHTSGKFRRRPFFPVWICVGVLLSVGCVKTPRMYRVGILVGSDAMKDVGEGFKTRMTELGYVEGKNIVYDERSSNGDPAEETRIAGIFVSGQADLVFAFPGQTASVVKAAAKGTKLPIVFAIANLEGVDLVDSLRNPGGNITGIRNPGVDSTLKCFERLQELIPSARRVMVVFDPNFSSNSIVLAALRPLASSYGATLKEVPVANVSDTGAVLRGLEKSGDSHVDAILLLPDLIARSPEGFNAVIRFADKHRVPVFGGPKSLLEKGVVFSAIVDSREHGKLAAFLADKIFKGVPAGTIPVLSPEIQFVINYKKARELGLTVPKGMLMQAAEIIR